MSSDPFNAVGRLFGYLLMAAGGLIALASGLCSGALLLVGGAGTISSAVRHPEAILGIFSGLPIVAIVGGVPFLLGVGLWKVGAWLAGPARKDPYE